MSQQKIISLVPSLTELLIDLGLEESLAGRTRFCIHPKEKVQEIPIIGGTKNPRVEEIIDAGADLIIANKEENREEDIRELEQHTEVILTDISSIEEALFAIYEIGKKCGVLEKAEKLIADIQTELELIPDESPMSAAYLIWRSPWMTAGGDTYIHSVMEHWKLQNVFSDQNRYPKITLDQIHAKRPELVLLSSEPFPFKEKHIQEIAAVCKTANIMLINGEWFSWYGSRMLPSFKKLNAFRRAIS